MSVAFVLWDGEIGGAETWSISLAREMVRRGLPAGVVVVGHAGSLRGAIEASQLPVHFLNLSRGSAVVRCPRRFASAVFALGSTAAVLPAGGYLARTLRVGGYRGKIVAVEHGSMLQMHRLPLLKRGVRMLDLLSGLGCVDAQVVPSDFMAALLRRFPHRVPPVRVYPGVDVNAYAAPAVSSFQAALERNEVRLGCAARLIPGKGVDVLLKAAQGIVTSMPWCLMIAGDGPERQSLERMATDLGLADRVVFKGWQSGMAAFWAQCDAAIVPSSSWTESFGMVAVEAMACGIPVVAARNGGLSEVVCDGQTGLLFSPGSAEELRERLVRYISQPSLRVAHGAAARERVSRKFTIGRCVDSFCDVLSGA